MLKKITIFAFLLALLACSNGEQEGYATTGTIEAYKVDIRASAPGKILYNNIPEGTKAQSGQLFTIIDTTDLHLQKEQLISKLDGLTIEFSSINNKEQQLKIRLKYLTKQVNRLDKLVASDGASQDKLDQIIMERDITRSQIDEIPVQRNALTNQQNQLRKQVDLLEYRISESTIVSPAEGVILQRYVEKGERIQPGHLLATVGLTDTVWVMMYIPETKLAEVNLGQDIIIEIDGQTNPLQGKVAWISSEAEFTPKTVYTEDTRTSLMYSVRVQVLNQDGLLKIGMPVKLRI